MPKEDILQPLPGSQVDRLTRAANRYWDAYLIDGSEQWEARGLTGDTIGRFRLGIVAEPATGHERYRGWLTIPYLGRNQNTGDVECWDLRFRCPESHNCKDEGHGKYQSLPGSGSRVFNVAAFDADPRILSITEGEINAMTLQQCGIPAVALGGSQKWKPHYKKLFAGVTTVLSWGDPDKAGAELNDKMGKELDAIPVVGSADINDIFLAGGSDAIVGMYERAING